MTIYVGTTPRLTFDSRTRNGLQFAIDLLTINPNRGPNMALGLSRSDTD